MFKSTLPGWMLILCIGFVFVAVFGYANHYIPKEQKEKAKLIKDYSRHVEDCFVEYTTRVSSMWYIVIGTIISAAALVAFVIAKHETIIAEAESWGVTSAIIVVVTLVLGFLFVDFMMIVIACAGETAAIRESKDHYWRAYGAITISKEDN